MRLEFSNRFITAAVTADIARRQGRYVNSAIVRSRFAPILLGAAGGALLVTTVTQQVFSMKHAPLERGLEDAASMQALQFSCFAAEDHGSSGSGGASH